MTAQSRGIINRLLEDEDKISPEELAGLIDGKPLDPARLYDDATSDSRAQAMAEGLVNAIISHASGQGSDLSQDDDYRLALDVGLGMVNDAFERRYAQIMGD